MATVLVGPVGSGSGDGVVSGTIDLPRIGAWHADLHIDSQTVPSGKVQISIGTAGALVGTVARAELYRGQVRARIVAGGAGLQKTTRPRHYQAPQLREPLAAIAADGGESVSTTGDRGSLALALPFWTTLAMPVGVAIQALVGLSSGAGWRMLADGSIWVGAETWPDAGITDVCELSETPEDAVVEIGLDQPFLMPGTTINGRQVHRVRHEIGSDSIRSTVWTQTFTPTFASDPYARWRNFYHGKVVKQVGDVHIDVVPDDAALAPPMAGIPLKTGIPGVVATVKPGTSVMVGFENGRGDRAFASIWDGGASAGASGGNGTTHLTIYANVIELGGAGLNPAADGVVRASTPCQFTGAPHFVGGGTSLVVLAKKGP